jgi:hypothetical protein
MQRMKQFTYKHIYKAHATVIPQIRAFSSKKLSMLICRLDIPALILGLIVDLSKNSLVDNRSGNNKTYTPCYPNEIAI